LYGEDRIRRDAAGASFALFRPVKTVSVSNDAGDDIVPFAIAEVSSKPYCVIFPLRFSRSARLYREQNPEIPVIILEGRYPENENPSGFALGANTLEYFIYKTDIESDFYRAAAAANAIDKGKSGKIVVFYDKDMPQARDAFLRGLYEQGNLLETMFLVSFSQYSESGELSCVIMAGSGHEFFERRTGTPVFMFSWLSPNYLPNDVVLVINDSPWVQVKQAVKLLSAGERTGLIKSKFQYLDRRAFGRGLLP